MPKEEQIYTPQEEFVNAFSHALGAIFAIYALIMLVVTSKTPLQVGTTAIYGATLFILFEASTCYHAMTNETAKKVFRKIDHSAIYLLIAGTYTPLLLMTVDFPNSVIFLSIIWYLAITGVVFSCITLKFKYLSTGLYVLMGWLSTLLSYLMWIKGFHHALFWLFTGGLFYTAGSYFYLKPKKFFHSIFHLLVLFGAICHYLMIMSLIK